MVERRLDNKRIQYLEDAEERDSFDQYREQFIHNCNGPTPCFLNLSDQLPVRLAQNLNDPSRVVPAQMLQMAFGSWRAAIMLALSGSSSQVPAILRLATETALYALLFSENEEIEAVWRARESDQTARRKLRDSRNGPLSKAKDLLAKRDPKLKKRVADNIDMYIDFGGHPNIAQLCSASQTRFTDESLRFDTFLLTSNSERIRSFVKIGACGIDICEIFSLAFPRRYVNCDGPSMIAEITGQFRLYLVANQDLYGDDPSTPPTATAPQQPAS